MVEDTFDGTIVISHFAFHIGAQEPKQGQREQWGTGGSSGSVALLL